MYTTIFGLGMFRTLSFMVKVDIYRDRNNAKWTIAIAPPLKKAHSKEGQHNSYLEQDTFVGCFSKNKIIAKKISWTGNILLQETTSSHFRKKDILNLNEKF